MPFYYDANGNKVHVQLILSVLAIINRTTAAVIGELATNFIGKRVSAHMKTLKTMKEKEKILFDVLKMYNVDYCEFLMKKYKAMTTEEKKNFLQYCEDVKIHFNQPSMGEKEPMFYRIMNLKEKYKDILNPDEMWVHQFGRDIRCVMDGYIANMYIITLKQTAKKGFSVRGIGAVSAKGIPERSYKSKSHKDLYSSTAIRFGEFETLNFCIAMQPEEVALIHAFYRTSVKARRDFGKALLNNEPIITVGKTYESRVAEFFEIILKSLGFRLEFLDSDDDFVELSVDDLQWFELANGKSVFCSEYDKYIIDRRTEIASEILEEYGALNIDELNEMIDDEIKDRQYFIASDVKDVYLNCVEIEPTLVSRDIVSCEEISSQMELIDVPVEV